MTIFNQNGHFRLKTEPISLQIVILEQKWPNSSKISLLYSPGPMRRTRISINIQESVLNVAGEKFEASGGKKVGNRHVAIFRACIWFTWLHLDTLNRKLNYETLGFRIYRSKQIYKWNLKFIWKCMLGFGRIAYYGWFSNWTPGHLLFR